MIENGQETTTTTKPHIQAGYVDAADGRVYYCLPSTVDDPELQAMHHIITIMSWGSLVGSQHRLAQWFADRFGPKPTPETRRY